VLGQVTVKAEKTSFTESSSCLMLSVLSLCLGSDDKLKVKLVCGGVVSGDVNWKTYNLAIVLLGVHPKERELVYWRAACTSMVRQQYSQKMSPDGWVDEGLSPQEAEVETHKFKVSLGYSVRYSCPKKCTMYSRRTVSQPQKAWNPFTGGSKVSLQNIRLSEMSQAQEDECHIFPPRAES
jgi:hypothetical protein